MKPIRSIVARGLARKPTSATVTKSRAQEGRGISLNVAPEAQIEQEIETRPEQEIATCEEGLGAARPFATDTGSLFTFSDKPKIVTAHTGQEVTEEEYLFRQ